MMAIVGPGRAARDRGAKRRRQPSDAPLHLEALLLQELGEPGGRLFLFEAELGIRVDLVGNRLELSGQRVHGAADLRLQLVQRCHVLPS